jgi:RimJ/RimL family protein N-acetyltransferase
VSVVSGQSPLLGLLRASQMLKLRIHPEAIHFRAIAEVDFPLMTRWLNEPHVQRSYGSGGAVTLDRVCAKYGPRVRREEPTDCYVIEYDGRPVGYVQSYRIADHPDYAAQVQVEEGAAGVDLFIGEPHLVGRGLGTVVLRRFTAEVVFAGEGITSCILGPDPGNAAAIRCYEKVGFRYLKTREVDGAAEYLMQLAAPAPG